MDILRKCVLLWIYMRNKKKVAMVQTLIKCTINRTRFKSLKMKGIQKYRLFKILSGFLGHPVVCFPIFSHLVQVSILWYVINHLCVIQKPRRNLEGGARDGFYEVSKSLRHVPLIQSHLVLQVLLIYPLSNVINYLLTFYCYINDVFARLVAWGSGAHKGRLLKTLLNKLKNVKVVY